MGSLLSCIVVVDADMRRRRVLAVGFPIAGALAGCMRPPWRDGVAADSVADVTFRREHTGDPTEEPTPFESHAELHTDLDASDPVLLVRGWLAGGSSNCYRVELLVAEIVDDVLELRLRLGDDPEGQDVCPEVAEAHPYEVEIAFDAPEDVPDRVAVDHEGEVVLERPLEGS